MNIYLKYPQKSKKQHKKRCAYAAVRNHHDFSSHKVVSQKFGLFVLQQYTLPKRYVSYIRKHFRKFFKKRRVCFWFHIQPNKLITSKSKNSRMGKGVGAINRVAYLADPKTPILVLSNISLARVSALSHSLSMRLAVPLQIRRL